MSRVIYKVFFSQCLLLFLLPTLKSQSIEGPESGSLSPGTVGFDQTTCIGGDPDLLTNEVSGTGVNATYQWVTRVVGGSWTDIAGANSSEYDPPAGITEKTFYRRRIDQSGATSLFSNTIEINVGPTASAGTIAGPTGTFCASYSGRLTSTTGGNGLSIEYQWQWRSTSSASAWEDILSDDNLAYYDVVNLTEEKEFRRLTKTCGLELSSNVLTVTVTGTTLDVGEIALDGSNVNCYNANAPDFISLEDPSGGDGSFDYLWQYKNADTNDLWDDAPGDNDDLSYSPGVLDKTTSYRRQVSSCTFTGETPAIVISVIPFLTAGAIDPNKDGQWVCYGGDATNLTMSMGPSGGDPGNYEYQWQQRTPGGSWTDATGTGNQNDNYTPMNLTSTQEFRVKVTSPGCSQEDDTDAITVNVHPELQKGSISVGSTDVCYGSAFTINSDVDATGGVNNSPTYHWQERTDPEDDGTYGAWQDIAGENAATLTITSASVDAEYRRAAQSCGPREYSDIITIDVSSSTMSPGSISSSRVVCYDTPPGEITGAQPPSGGNGTFDYLWQHKSEDTGDLWEDAPGVNDELTYTPGSLIKTTSYRRRVESCNITEFTAAVTMTVTPSLTAGAIDPNKDGQWVCYGGDATNLTMSTGPSGGDPGNYTYQWQQRTPGGSWTDATGTGNQNDNYTPMNLTSTQEFRVKVTSPGCSQEDDTDAITVNVHPELQKGSISVGSTDVCYGSAFTINSDVDATGGVNNSPTYHWQERTDPEDDGTYGAWQDIAGENAATLTITSASVDAEYRRAAQSCGPREYSDIITIDVSSSTMSPGSISSSRVVCYDTPPGEITGAQPPSGGNGTFDYLWQHKSEDTGDLWEDAPGVNDELTYTPGSLIKTTSYRRRVESCNITEFTAAVTMTVTPSLTAGAIDPNKDGQWVCYGGDATNLTMSTGPSGGDPGNYTYQWQQRTPGGSWTDATGTGNQNDNYTPMNLTSTQEFRVKVTSPGCSQEDDTDAITVNVHPDVVPGEINGPSTLCYGELAVFTSEIAGSGGVPGGLSYKWQQRTGPAFDGSYGPWEDIDSGESDNANGILSTYNTTLTESMEFRRSIYACGPREYSNVIAVSVDLPLLPAITDLEVCSGAPVTLTPVGSLPSGATYHWYEEDGGPVVHTGDTYPTSFTQDAILYVIAVSSGGCEGPQKTIQVEVNPSPEAPGVIGASLCETGSVELAVNAQAGYTYQWYDMSDQYLASGTTYSTPQISTTTQYKVRATNNLGCTSEESIVTAAINTVAVPVDPEIVQSCNHLYLSVTESTDTDVTYYWQGQNSTGKSTSQPASGYYRVEQSGTYYIRAYNDATNCWSLATDIVVDTELLAPPSRIVPIDCDGAMAGNIYTPPAAYDNSDTYSYTRVYTAIEEGLTYETITDPTQPKEDVSIVTSFVDGLGRPLQTVSKEASPQGFDMVQPVYYDQFGRSSRQYINYADNSGSGELKLNPFSDQQTMLKGLYGDEDVFHSLTFYDGSPLNKETKQMAAGNAWAGNFVGLETTYGTNVSGDDVRIFTLGLDPATDPENVPGDDFESYAIPVTTAVYDPGTLYVHTTKDENDNLSKTYTDKLGRVVLEKIQNSESAGLGHAGWANTYYVYNSRGKMVYILPPKAVEIMEVEGWIYTGNVIQSLVFHYSHDGRGRQKTKLMPGSGRVDMVYDRLDRMVASQEANQRDITNPYWSFTKFDHHNRPVLVGLYNSTEDRETLQVSLQDHTYSVNVTSEVVADPNTIEGVIIKLGHHEPGTTNYTARQRVELLPGFNSGDDHITVSLNENLSIDNAEGYNDGTFPTLDANAEVIETIYYDDYRFTNKSFSTDYPAFSTSADSVDPEIYAQTNDLRTGSRLRVLGTDMWLENVLYYDDRGRIIQKRMSNKNGGEMIETRQYDFEGKQLQVYTQHTNPEADINSTNTLKKYSYDHQARLTKVEHALHDNGNLKVIGTYSYNEIGDLQERVLGDNLESLNYTYNLRGWLTGINGEAVDAEGIMEDHFFGMQLNYDRGFSQAQLNGNISGVKWKTKTDPTVRAYGYAYDHNNRIIKADYSEGDDIWVNTTYDFSVDNISYDANGNLQTLRRMGVVGGLIEEIDDITYTYKDDSPNQLLRVSDNSESEEGFKNPNEALDDFVYDEAGNLLADNNKDIQSVKYNYMGLPELVTMVSEPEETKTVTFVYDAKGKKLSEVTNDNGEITTIDYIDGFTYEGNELKTFGHDEGRVRNTGHGLVYDYYVKDHLNNTRMTLTEDVNKKVYLATLETDYDPVQEVNLGEYEAQIFFNMDAARDAYNNANYTVNLNIATNEAARLNGSQELRRIGPGKMLAVNAGDMVDMEAFAYYEGTPVTGERVDPSGMVNSIASAFGGLSGGTFEQNFIFDNFSTNATAISALTNVVDETQPAAYLNYLLFDENFNYLDGGFVQVSADAQNNHEKLMLRRSILKNGFMYIYVSNESDVDFNVWFDDLRITHTQGTILQEDHYYPFGMKIKALSFAAEKVEGLPGGDKFGLGWQDLGFRNYDNRIGRFFNTDPLGEYTVDQSTYHYAGNNPISQEDVLGLNKNNRLKRRFRQTSRRSKRTAKKEARRRNRSGEYKYIQGASKTVAGTYRAIDVANKELNPNYNPNSSSAGDNNESTETATATSGGGTPPPEDENERLDPWAAILAIKLAQAGDAAQQAGSGYATDPSDPGSDSGGTDHRRGDNRAPQSTNGKTTGTKPGDSRTRIERLTSLKIPLSVPGIDNTEKQEEDYRRYIAGKVTAKEANALDRKRQYEQHSDESKDGNASKVEGGDKSDVTVVKKIVAIYKSTIRPNGISVTGLADMDDDTPSDDDPGEDDDYNVPLDGSEVPIRVTVYITVPGGAKEETTVTVEGEDLNNAQKKELLELIETPGKLYLKQLVEQEKENLKGSQEERRQAVDRINIKFKAFVDALVNNIKGGGLGARFLASRYPTTTNSEDRNRIINIANQFNRIGNVLFHRYIHVNWEEQPEEYELIYDMEEYVECPTLGCFEAEITNLADQVEEAEERIRESDEADRIIFLLLHIRPAPLVAVPLDVKKKALESVANTTGETGEASESDKEEAAIKVLESIAANPDQRKPFVKYIHGEPDTNTNTDQNSTPDADSGGKALKKLDEEYHDRELVFGDGNYSRFAIALVGIGQPIIVEDQPFLGPVDEEDVFIWDDNYDNKVDSEMDETGEISITVRKVIGSNTVYVTNSDGTTTSHEVPVYENPNPEPKVYKPFDPIVIYPRTSLSHLGIPFDPNSGFEPKPLIVPAALLHYMTNQEKTNAENRGIWLMVDVISLPITIGGAIFTGAAPVFVFIAAVDIVATGLNVAVQSQRDNIINDFGDEGRDFVESVEIWTGLVNAGAFGIETVYSLPKLFSKIKRLKVKYPKNWGDLVVPAIKNKINEMDAKFGDALSDAAVSNKSPELQETTKGFREAGGTTLVEESGDVVYYTNRVDENGVEVGEEVAKITTDPNTGEDVLEITSQRVLDKTGDMDPADAAELITDLQSNPKLLVEMNKNPELVDAWEVLNNAGVSQVAKSDVNNIANYSEYLEKSEAFTQQESAISVFDKTDGTHYAHNSPSNPEFDIDASQELTFSYKYKTGPNANSKDVYGKVGLTDDGYLVANIRKTTGMENMNVTGVTEDAMDMALKEFGGIENVNGVKALWVENATLYPNTPGNKSTNLLLFEDALQSLPPDQAIFQTITGGYAKNRVFSKVISIRKLTESVDGVNGYEVIFGK